MSSQAATWESTAEKKTVVPKKAAASVKLVDKAADLVIRAGGLLIIGAVFAIMFFLIKECVPLFMPAKSEIVFTKPWPGLTGEQKPLFVGIDNNQAVAYALDAGSKSLILANAYTWQPILQVPIPALAASEITASYRVPYEDEFFAGTQDGKVLAAKMPVETTYGADNAPSYLADVLERFFVQVGQDPVRLVHGRVRESNVYVAAVLESASGQSVFSVIAPDGEEPVVEPVQGQWDGVIRQVLMDDEGSKLLVLTDKGTIYHYFLDNDRTKPFAVYEAKEGRRPTAIEWVIGDASMLVGFSDGSLEHWLQVRKKSTDVMRAYVKSYDFDSLKGAVTAIVPSSHTRGFVAASDGGSVHVGFTTSERTLLKLQAPAPVEALVYGAKNTAVLAYDKNKNATIWTVENPHPETTFKTLFSKVWYEGFDQPEFAWQSSSGSDSFEAKYSLTPLIVGTVKGAFYGLLFAVPMAIFAALYTSQFMHWKNRAIVKPTVEIMAACPSVVVGFLAGLWLAPLLESVTVSVLLMVFVIPTVVLALFMCWSRVPQYYRDKVPHGMELVILVPAVIVGFMISNALGPVVEDIFFQANFKQWVFNVFGEQMEQRNCIVIGLAMGFAVIPIIFTISEDALTNVPRHFVSGSLALGASRWQTATRVILPTASPGIFSAVMIGFGRAVGETMIVLMATGNTPIMSMSPFNGMRTLSANIAVEIPEAPVGSTHYRVLFLAAVVLFMMTFAVNTAAEIVRQRLREKYQAV